MLLLTASFGQVEDCTLTVLSQMTGLGTTPRRFCASPGGQTAGIFVVLRSASVGLVVNPKSGQATPDQLGTNTETPTAAAQAGELILV